MKILERKTVYAYTRKELKAKINSTIDKIEAWVSLMDYRFIGDINKYKKMRIPVYNISKNQLKKINKYLNTLNKKMTMRKVNSFLHLFYKTFEPKEKVQIKKSLKEEEIQRKRKAWLKLRDDAETALLEYKIEKGDYYKLRIKRQKKLFI